MKPIVALIAFVVGTASLRAQSTLWTNPRGLPSGEPWVQRVDERTSSTFRVYQIGENGPIVSLNPQTSEVVKNPVNGVYEAVIREDLVKGNGEEETTASADPVWPVESGELTLNSDAGELAKNVYGQYEAVINESAFSGEEWNELVPSGTAISAAPATPTPATSRQASTYALQATPSAPSLSTATTPAPANPNVAVVDAWTNNAWTLRLTSDGKGTAYLYNREKGGLTWEKVRKAYNPRDLSMYANNMKDAYEIKWSNGSSSMRATLYLDVESGRPDLAHDEHSRWYKAP